jgi:hypothetical protein
MYGTPVNLHQPYEWNDKFTITKSSFMTRREMRVATDIVFPTHDPEYQPKDYFTVFGPSISHTGTLYANDAIGLQGAIRRLTSIRCPGEMVGGVSKHQHLLNNQYANFTYDRFQELITLMQDRMTHIFSNEQRDVCELRNEWCDKPHVKRALRIKTRKEMHERYEQTDTHIDKDVLHYKAKTFELLQENKYLRAVADMYAPACTRAGYLADYVKEAFQQPVQLGNRLYAAFVKEPQLDMLKFVFDSIINPRHDVTFFYFSDDAILAVKCIDGILRSDSDISKSDGSQYDRVFTTLRTAIDVDYRFFQDFEVSFRQLKVPFIVRNPEKWSEYCIVSPDGYVLYSGSVWTTTVNNWANLCIIWEFTHHWYNPNGTMAENAHLYQQAAEHLGYIVKIKLATEMEELSFLKHFPAFNGTEFVPNLCVGVICRALGKTKGDLPGSSKIGIASRATEFNAQFVESLKHAGNHVVIDALQHWTKHKRVNLKTEHKVYSSGTLNFGTTEGQSICKRYGISVDQLEEFVVLLKHSTLNSLLKCDASDAMMSLDYGM